METIAFARQPGGLNCFFHNSPGSDVTNILSCSAVKQIPSIWIPDIQPLVITSYSIHYTKLYDVRYVMALSQPLPSVPIGYEEIGDGRLVSVDRNLHVSQHDL